MEGSHMTGKILRLTLKILYLLTGEDYVPIKRCEEDDMAAPVPPSRERVNDEQVLDLTNKIIELLTGEGERLKEVKDEEMSNPEEDGEVWATLTCKEEEIPMAISADRCCQTNSQERGSISPLDSGQCKEEETATDFSAGKSRLNHMDGAQTIADLPGGTDLSETTDTRLNIVVIDAAEGDVRFKEEEEEIPIAPQSDGPRNTSPRSLRPPNTMEATEDEDDDDDDDDDDESDDTETDEDDEDEDERIRGLKIMVKTDKAETGAKRKNEAAAAELGRGCKRACTERGATSAAAGRPTFPIDRKLMTAEKPFYCPDCGGFFKHKSSLVLHRRIHSGEKPFTCTQCGKEFIQKANYLRHQRLHTGEKPYKCTECGKLYAQKQSLIMHQKFHAENEPFSCPECGESFIRQSHLVNHRKSHKGLKRYSCPDCGDFFMLRSSLVIHQRVHSAERPFTC